MPAARDTGNDIDSVNQTPAHSWAAGMGPGLASTAADNDPSGIATYSLAGAQWDYGMVATSVLSYPFVVALQLVSVHIAAVTGQGLTENACRIVQGFPRNAVSGQSAFSDELDSDI